MDQESQAPAEGFLTSLMGMDTFALLIFSSLKGLSSHFPFCDRKVNRRKLGKILSYQNKLMPLVLFLASMK